MNRRQVFLSHKQYHDFLESLAGEEAHWQTHSMMADSPEQEASLKASTVRSARLHHLILGYTGGAPMEQLARELDGVIEGYEDYQRKLEVYEERPDIAPLNIEDYPDEYEEYVQVISLCILLQRSDLLPRLVLLQDRAGFGGQDTLIEDLLKPYLPDRAELDEWYHSLYSPLIWAIYSEDPDEPRQLLVEYCNQWYEAFEQAPWHDSHLQGDEGSYFGYWAFEAAAVAYLFGLDDSAVKHMIFPREMLEYARRFTPPISQGVIPD
ncbi:MULTISPECIES: PoNe immunity protein domain-containing protein [Pseudomonas]|uniref:PoNe immunity protein domain-containing protein n=1 Tax=Pseudomonas TaxID=286 RepID=UPI000C9C6736|nr:MULTISPECIES: PoNe immunity protein domain-containing protein [Pseudomonas]AXK52125.1 DUF1911 domain-containing protein [Pseudomonas protegens]MDP4572857.1 DUF1911 domain-containing protein [Pseudomonas sp. LPH60]PNG31766.1 hypothetical protein A1348_17690 [Pseudomonas protegens]